MYIYEIYKMEPQNSNRSSSSSVSGSVDKASNGPPSLHSPSQYRTSQSLTSVINTPEGSIFEYIYDYIYKSFTFGVEPSAILQDIDPKDFNPYLNKIIPYFKEKNVQEIKRNSNEYTVQRCYEEIPKVFFAEDFNVESFLDENVLNQNEMISTYLDITDVSIFTKISDK